MKVFEQNGLYGLKDNEGNIVVPAIHRHISDEGDVFIYSDSNRKEGLISSDGILLTEPIYNWVHSYGDLFVVQKGSDFLGSAHKGVLDYNGNIILPVEYDYLEVTDEGNIVAHKDQYVAYRHDGTVLIPSGKYDDISSCPGGFLVEKNDKAGLIGLDGDTEILPIEYDGIQFFGDDLICVKKNKKEGLIRKDGSIVLPLEYDDISNYSSLKDDLYVTKDNKKGIVQNDGNFLLPVEYDYLTTCSKEYDGLDCYIAKKNDKKGVFLTDGTALTELIYDNIIIYENGLIVKKDNSYYLLSLTGKDIGQCKADENGVYSPDGTTLLVFLSRNPVIIPEVKTCREIKNRLEIDTITFAEGHTALDESWNYDGRDCIDHDPCLEEIVLPSTIKQISGRFFSMADPNKIKVPQGMVDYFRGIVPERLKEKVVE